jgi:regulator of protease activity HflC (stomatin/prohibitin superfamily)
MNKTHWGIVVGVGVVALLLLQQFWQWEVERVEVAPQKYLVRVHRWGKELPEGEIVAPDDSYKGVVLDVLQEGRHFLNPIFWGYELHDIVVVPPGQCLVLTRKFGKEIPKDRFEQGDILARDGEREIDGERGIVREVKLPGNYRLNPYAYSWETVKAVEIGPDQVGVRTLKVGEDPRSLPADKRPRYVVPDNYRGVQQTPVRNGTYYINPYVQTITPVEVRSHLAELSDIEFPSRDGFILKPHVMVEYQVRPDKAPEVLVRLTDEGILHQHDSTPQEQDQNEILQKVLLPHIRGYARIEGSNFDARDFILTTSGAADEKASNTREKLQKALLAKVQPRCQELGIEIRAVLLKDMKPPPELAEQISQRDIARVKQDQNKSLVGQYKEEQKLKSIEAMKQQFKEKVEADTRLFVMKTDAQRLKQVEESKLKQDLENARIRLDAARSRAEALLVKGKADADVILKKNEAEVSGQRKAVQGFGSAMNFAQYQMVKQLAPALREIFASDDSEFSKLFSSYMTPAPGNPAKAPVPVSQATPSPANGQVKK